MKQQIVALVGIARAIPDVNTFVTPVFETADGTRVRQEVNDSKVSAFVPIPLGEEFEAIDFPLSVKEKDDAIYAFEISKNDFFIGSHKGLGRAVAYTFAHLVNEKAQPSTWNAVQRFLTSSESLGLSERPVFRCSKSSRSESYVVASYGLNSMEKLDQARAGLEQPMNDKKMTPEEAALMLAVIPLNKEVSASLMLSYFSRSLEITITEEQVLKALCDSLSTPEIAVQMKLAVSTVRSHVRSLCSKTNSTGVRELVSRANSLMLIAASGGYMHEYRMHGNPIKAFERDVRFSGVEADSEEKTTASVPQVSTGTEISLSRKEMLSEIYLKGIRHNEAIKTDTLSGLVSSLEYQASTLAEKFATQIAASAGPKSLAAEVARFTESSRTSRIAIAELVRSIQTETETAMDAVIFSAQKLTEGGEKKHGAFNPIDQMQSATSRLRYVTDSISQMSSAEILTSALVTAKVNDIFSVDIVASAGSQTAAKKMGELSVFAGLWSKSLAKFIYS